MDSKDPAGSPLHQLVAGSRLHEAMSVPLSSRLRWALWLMILLDVACAICHRLLLEPWASGFIAQMLSWGGHWTLATVAMIASAIGLAVMGILTDGFRMGTGLHLKVLVILLIISAASAGPTLVFGVVAAALLVIAVAVLALIVAGLLMGALNA